MKTPRNTASLASTTSHDELRTTIDRFVETYRHRSGNADAVGYALFLLHGALHGTLSKKCCDEFSAIAWWENAFPSD